MYRGFKLDIQDEFEEYFEKGRSLYVRDKAHIKHSLSSFLSDDGMLDGSKIEDNWFKQIKADVFISHSHEDRRIAIALAGWLSSLGIRAFVDSCIWGNSDELLRLIDNEHCYQSLTHTYSYERRNRTTSHVHMMLSTALMKMIDKTECLFFINTPRSISTSEVVDQTESPWIYAELSMTELIRINIPSRVLDEERRTFSKGGRVEMFEHVQIMKHNVNLKHLRDLSVEGLLRWANFGSYSNADVALDKLYKLYPVSDLIKG